MKVFFTADCYFDHYNIIKYKKKNKENNNE